MVQGPTRFCSLQLLNVLRHRNMYAIHAEPTIPDPAPCQRMCILGAESTAAGLHSSRALPAGKMLLVSDLPAIPSLLNTDRACAEC